MTESDEMICPDCGSEFGLEDRRVIGGVGGLDVFVCPRCKHMIYHYNAPYDEIEDADEQEED